MNSIYDFEQYEPPVVTERSLQTRSEACVPLSHVTFLAILPALWYGILAVVTAFVYYLAPIWFFPCLILLFFFLASGAVFTSLILNNLNQNGGTLHGHI